MHATAIVIGTRGILFVGASGSGKSTIALACLEAARNAGTFSALVADDQIFIEKAGSHAIASRPDSIAGLMEIRYSGIATLPSIESAVLHLAVMVCNSDNAERLPPDADRYTLPCGIDLPILRLTGNVIAPLAIIQALFPATFS